MALYRFFDQRERLLYIGICDEPVKRWYSHAKRPWWPEVATFHVAWFPSREEASKAERDAIIAERPAHNVVLNGVPYAGDRFPGALFHELAWDRFGQRPFNFNSVAEELGIPYGSVPFHIRRLERAGDVRALGKVKTGAGSARLHFVISRPPPSRLEDSLAQKVT